jgi:hypothetical protein
MKLRSLLQSPLGGLIAAQLVVALVLVENVFTVLSRIHGRLNSDALNKKISSSNLVGTSITADLVAYGLAVLTLHLAVGLIGYLLAVATRRSVSPARGWALAPLAASWTAALFVWVHAANAALFPWSTAIGSLNSVANWSVGALSLFDVLSLVLLLGSAFVLIGAVRASRLYALTGPRILIYPAAAVVAVAFWRIAGIARADVAGVTSTPHVIVIGIDSLRPDAVGTGGVTAVTPHIDRFLAESIRFDDTITPLARTFPSWLTILTGRHPVSTGARENLLPRESLAASGTLGEVLGVHGYQTVYATDEVRSSNIDETYGFDRIIGPKIGALDFLLASVNDIPLSNLVANSFIGKLLFPYTYINRGAAVTYRPETFVRELNSQLEFGRPTFLAVHLTLPHWPYHWSDDYEGSLAESLRQPYLYSSSLIGVDRQFGQLLRMLEEKGALNNAIVILLSDHGEGLGFPEDNLLTSREAKQAARGITVTAWGHGNSVLSPSQYQVLMAWRGFGAAEFPVRDRRSQVPSSLEDVTPTVLELLDIPVRGGLDGLSLAAYLQAGMASAGITPERIRFTESGITVGFTRLGDAKVRDIVERGALAYGLNPDNGRLELKSEYLAELMKSKERAAIGRSQILAAIPATDGSTRYVLVDRSGGTPRFLDGGPDALSDPETGLLWRSLMDRYQTELALPAG